jgi:hypothetical protein
MKPKPPNVEIPDDTTWEKMSPQQRHYYRNKDEWHERIKNRKSELKSWVNETKAEAGCNRCSEGHPACLDYHHIDGDKDRGVSKMAKDGVSKDKIREEMEKCIVLCANCHRKEHWDD